MRVRLVICWRSLSFLEVRLFCTLSLRSNTRATISWRTDCEVSGGILLDAIPSAGAWGGSFGPLYLLTPQAGRACEIAGFKTGFSWSALGRLLPYCQRFLVRGQSTRQLNPTSVASGVIAETEFTFVLARITIAYRTNVVMMGAILGPLRFDDLWHRPQSKKGTDDQGERAIAMPPPCGDDVQIRRKPEPGRTTQSSPVRARRKRMSPKRQGQAKGEPLTRWHYLDRSPHWNI